MCVQKFDQNCRSILQNHRFCLGTSTFSSASRLGESLVIFANPLITTQSTYKPRTSKTKSPEANRHQHPHFHLSIHRVQERDKRCSTQNPVSIVSPVPNASSSTAPSPQKPLPPHAHTEV